jgi:hypothetical protein
MKFTDAYRLAYIKIHLKNRAEFPIEVYNVQNNEGAYWPFKDEAQAALVKDPVRTAQ